MPLLHGEQPILGFRFGRFAYLTDCSAIPEASFALLDGLDVLVLDALRHRQHPTHFTVAEATAAARRHRRRGRPTSRTSATTCRTPRRRRNLPAGVALAYDGLALEVDVTPPRRRAAPERVMDVVYYPGRPASAALDEPVLALGNFDGLHRGHQKIIERIRRGAAERGGTAVVLTFDPHPPRVVRPDKAPPLLMTLEQKLEALDRAGVQGVAVVRFTHELSRWEPETLRQARCWSTGCASPRCGSAPTFCSAAIGPATSRCCARSAQQYGFRAEKIDPVRYKDFVVSSTRIRRLVGEGRVDEAGALLGHHYVIDGMVVQGARRGRELGFPTANLSTENELVPPTGVYATAIDIARHPLAVDHQHRACGRRSRRPGRSRSRPMCSGCRPTSTARRCRWASCSGSGTSAASPTSTR